MPSKEIATSAFAEQLDVTTTFPFFNRSRDIKVDGAIRGVKHIQTNYTVYVLSQYLEESDFVTVPAFLHLICVKLELLDLRHNCARAK